MSLTDMVIMPGADYQAACDAIREKTEGVGYIRSGDMAELIRGIEAGVELPELRFPASASEIGRGFEAIGANGEMITGTAEIKSTNQIQLPINNYSSNPVLVVSESNPNGLVIASGAEVTITEVVDSVYSVFFDSNTQGADWQNRGGECRLLYVTGSLTPSYPRISQTFTQVRLFKMLEFDEYDGAYIEFYDN